MPQPKLLKLPSAYRGNAYEASILLKGYEQSPSVSAVFRHPSSNIRLRSELQPGELVVEPAAGNPTHWKARLSLATTRSLPERVWVEVIVNGVIDQAGYLLVNYQIN